MIRNGFLIQNAYNDIDSHTNTIKTLGIIKLILLLYIEGQNLLRQGKNIEDIVDLEIVNSILRISQMIPNEAFKKIEKIKNKLILKLRTLSI